MEAVLPTFLHRYAKRYPNVKVEFIEAVGPDILTLVERGEVHLGISLMRAVQSDTIRFASYRLAAVEFLAACGPSLALGHSGRIDIRDLAPYPLLLLNSGFAGRKTFDAACHLAELEPNILYESRAPHTLLALAEAGHGVAIIPSAVLTHRYDLQLVRITHQRKPLREPVAVIWDKRRMLPRYADGFFEPLAAHMPRFFRWWSRQQARPAPRQNGPACARKHDEFFARGHAQWEAVKVFEDAGISGGKGSEHRPGLEELLKAVARREIDMVAAWSVDRLGRTLMDLLALLKELHAKGVDLFLHQQGLDTSTPSGRAMFQMMGVFAEFERAMIRERVRSGLRARVRRGRTGPQASRGDRRGQGEGDPRHAPQGHGHPANCARAWRRGRYGAAGHIVRVRRCARSRASDSVFRQIH